MLELFIAQDLARKRYRDTFDAATPVGGKAPGAEEQRPSSCKESVPSGMRPLRRARSATQAFGRSISSIRY
jgi:hypothetical protein